MGSPAVTTRGFGEPDMQEVAGCIGEILSALASRPDQVADVEASVRKRVKTLTARFPLYAWRRAAVGA
jgi:glycine hydroxymethyltransferase